MKRLPRAADFGIDLASRKEQELFKWFLLCLLYGKPIQREIAEKAFHRFVAEGLVTPEAILRAGWDELVRVLDEAHYVRYDFSTATKLLTICQDLQRRYGRLTDLLGQGGMATVYKGYREDIDRYVAVKVLPPHPGLDAQFIDRFKLEARTIARLQHPHILPLYDYGAERSFTRGQLRRLLQAHGLDVVAEDAILFIPGWLRMLDLACHAWWPAQWPSPNTTDSSRMAAFTSSTAS